MPEGVKRPDRLFLKANLRGAMMVVATGLAVLGWLEPWTTFEAVAQCRVICLPPWKPGGCTCKPPPVSREAEALPIIQELPDPFRFQNGARMATVAEWKDRRDEIRRLAERFQYGVYPARPDKVTGTFAKDTLTVSLEYQGQVVPHTATVIKPDGIGPFPAIIALSNLPGLTARELNARGVALITLQQPVWPEQLGRWEVVGLATGNRAIAASDAPYTGAAMASGWDVHRILDALETTTGAGIDPKRVGVAGFGRYANGALAAGAFDERIALTILLEPGCGLLRGRKGQISRFPKSIFMDPGEYAILEADRASARANGLPDPYDCRQPQDLLHSSPYWGDLSADFVIDFAYPGRSIARLPFDTHEVIALIAPRPIVIQQQSTQNHYNDPEGAFGAAWGAKTVFDYLGASDRIGWVADAHPDSVVMTSRESSVVLNFVDRFLVGKGGISTNQFDMTATPPEVSWKAPATR